MHSPRSSREDQVKQKIDEALRVLELLGLPDGQRNERSALTLLALLNLKPGSPWRDAQRPPLGITQMMGYFAEHYGRRYAPNTRETVRRQTVHQFMDAGLVIPNPDRPDRPTNSPKWCYQITEEAHCVLVAFGRRQWKRKLAEFRENVVPLREKYAQRRRSAMIAVEFPDGQMASLSAGVHNELVRDVVQQFCPRFIPDGQFVYVGDTAEKWAHFDSDALKRLGVSVDSHGKFPDIVIYDAAKKWLFLVEAVTSHGPVDPKRHNELKRLFSDCEAGTVFVTAFPDRAALTKYLSDISWETEVWIAESPGHIIHFDGDRFLGPY
jgi:hypothetical protein